METSNGVHFKDYFKGKKVTVMRIGLLGRGIGDTAYMADAGAEISVVDAASQEVMQGAVDQLVQYKNISWKFGPYDFVDFKDADFVLVGAGAPLDEAVLLACKEAGVPLKQSAALFAELSGVPIIGVTGTRGKSTVTHMIHHVLSMVTGEKVLLGGNVRGLSNLQLLSDVTPDSLCVMELDSWQLQGFGWAGISPAVAVFTNFMDDHLNYYQRGNKSYEVAMSAYFLDKAQIFLHQEESGVLITTPEVFARAKTLSGSLGQEVILADSSIIPEDCLLAMPGEHNRLNAALAYEALKATGLTEDEIFDGLASFPGVEGRLQLVSYENGVKIYNDNNATTPTATATGIASVKDGTNVILIAGGADKGLDLSSLVIGIEGACKLVVLTPGTGTEKLTNALAEIHSETPYLVVANLTEAVEEAALSTAPGDVILFSPAFASFAQYKNEYERNDEFMRLVMLVEEDVDQRSED
jgi:UDP-N-acetylmuramoylalanine--D-glutamate ligase